MPTPTLQTILITDIQHTANNPRRDPGADIEGLAASLGPADAPLLAQPPLVEALGGGAYRIIAGERRVLAAAQAGWTHIPCLVHPAMDPLQAHTLRLAENLHRRDLHPLDEAAALKIAWLAANAEAMGCAKEAGEVLAQESPPSQAILSLQDLLAAHGFMLTRPAVQWDELLARLGLDIHPERRKKLLRVLGLDAAVQEQARGMALTEAALRSLGTLEAGDQQRLVAELEQDPALVRTVRRIARTVREGTHTLEQALAEVRGQVLAGDEEPGSPVIEPPAGSDGLAEDWVSDQVIILLDAANQITATLDTLRDACQFDLVHLPPPWGGYVQDALARLQEALQQGVMIVKGGKQDVM